MIWQQCRVPVLVGECYKISVAWWRLVEALCAKCTRFISSSDYSFPLENDISIPEYPETSMLLRSLASNMTT